MLRRAHKGTFDKISPKHLQRYIDEFAHRHGIRNRDTLDQMEHAVPHSSQHPQTDRCAYSHALISFCLPIGINNGTNAAKQEPNAEIS